MARFATPGVYIKEKNAFGYSVVQTPTAIPCFIGYTEKATRGRDSLLNKPTRVTSMKEFVNLFGGGPKTTFSVKAKGDNDYELKVDKNTQFNTYNSIRLFYANGGGTCYVISVGDYNSPINPKDLNNPETGGGLTALLTEQEPSMVVVPDATLLDKGSCYGLYQEVLRHCGADTKSRFAILDVYDGYKERTFDENDIVNQFRMGVGNNFLAFGAGYYPNLITTIYNSYDFTYKNISNVADFCKILVREAEIRFLDGASLTKPTAPAKPEGAATEEDKKKPTPPPSPNANAGLDERMVKKFETVRDEIDKMKDPKADTVVVDQNLRALSPIYRSALDKMKDELNVMSPSGAIAGVYALVDNNIGVHKAPANVSVSAVVGPCIGITSEAQEDLNLPISGKAVNAIRGFMGKGTLIWGARTLDGNSQDWRYINVRRTMIMIEQSVKYAVENYVFEPNTQQTWIKVKATIDNFLTNLWRDGALVGPSPSAAFNVSLGLGVTMTPVDILDGIMRVSVKVAISRPAEFIEITFEQKMQEAGSTEGLV